MHRFLSSLMVFGFLCSTVFAQSVQVTTTNPFEGSRSLEWGPPIGWSSNRGGVCGDANDEDPGLACIHVGVPEGTRSIQFSGAVDVSGLDPGLKLVAWLATLNSSFSAIGISEQAAFPGGAPGYQEFTLSGNVTSEDSTWFVIPIFKVRVIGEPDNSFVGNADSTSVIFIDNISVSYNGEGENLLSNGGWENDDLSEAFANLNGMNAWRPPDCATPSVQEEGPRKPEKRSTPADDAAAFMKLFSTQNPDMVIERVLIPPKSIPAFLVYMRVKEADLKPGVIIVHGHNSDKRFMFAFNWPRDLAYMGYAVLAIDAWGHGERDTLEERLRLEAENWYNAATIAIFETVRELPQICEYFGGLPGVDGDRIGLMGPSMGGCITIAAAAQENSIAAFVPVSSGCDYINWFKTSILRPGGDVLPEETIERIKANDPVYLVEKIAGRPVRFVHGLNDYLLPPDYALGLYEKLKPLYKDCPERLDWKGHDVFALPEHRAPDPREMMVTHSISPGMSQDAFDWLEEFLKKGSE